MRLVTDRPNEPPVLWHWMNRQTNLPWSSDLRMVGLMRKDGTIAAAVGFNCWTEKACWMHVAFDSPHCLNRTLLRAAFEYPFIKCGKETVYGLTPLGNEPALQMNRRVGFRELVKTVDCMMFEMNADECRWLKESAYGRKKLCAGSA